MVAPTAEQVKRADAALAKKRAARKAAQEQAAKDARAVETAPTDEVRFGQQVPLRMANQAAREIDRELKQRNVDAAKAAAQAVSKALSGQTRPTTKAAVKASPRPQPENAAATPGPVKPPRGSASTRPIPASTGVKQ